MKYVIDCATAFKWFVAEADTPKALVIRDDFKQGICELLAPDLFPTELANALLMEEQKKVSRIGPGDAELYLTQALKLLPIIHDAVPLLPRAQEIAKQHRQSVYDCLYVALAELEQCEFITADIKLVNALQPVFPFVVSLASLP
ncbi:MAG: type II toxin-antitoxin system VapC family toxin [Planctomycetes bacterium]|nr:type II toxin-antitoxin system VapC family toxin [Planctomycetota bacterium]